MTGDILLVDDEAGIRKVLGISLTDLGYTVHTAENAAAALTIIEAVRPSITLTDIKMPGMDGIDLLKAIKGRYPDTEVIMLTGHGDMDLAIESLKFQATDFITKPISDDALTVALQRAGERLEMRRQLKAYTENLEHLVEEKSRQLIEAERLAAVGETVAGLSHTIKNITGGLDGGMFVLGKGIELEDAAYLKQGWELVRGNVDRIKTLSLDLLNFAKTDRLEYRQVNPEQPAREVFDLMQSRAQDHGMDLILDVAAGLAPTQMDPEGIHQCLLNLVTNAIDACVDTEPGDGAQRITLSVRPLADGGISYQVADTCCGMDERTKARLFQRFFSTKGERGTGIGLMLTRTIVHRHNGTIDVTSQPGRGACFTINLPG
ncbi:sensor histidine kinase [Desulfosarcina sp.]|uniref:sensor histidine kinase n=1 Tax=Desulfosarcina sp. TaxID=2027861 RepID=UPI0029B4610C|nr:response regulator [Desulfosarcina sp.]MDX2455526.1 response regulator [Desulfosarcina sp.]MDX2493015.1 response regulator [Desulfosarcina sp.]